MKKLFLAFVSLLIVISMTACGSGTPKGYKIPDVFGISYTDAIAILEAEGFEVKAIETSVASISEKLLYPLENVPKGTVFKVDDYILDNNGHLTQNYDVFYDGEFTSEDKSLVIYYAKEDYIISKENNTNSPTKPTDNPANTPTTPTPTPTNPTTSIPSNDSALSSDFKAAMDSYEQFMDEYVAFMKKFKANPSDYNLLLSYADYMNKYSEFVAAFEKWENEDLNSAESAYYLEVQTRVSKKLLETI